MTLPPWTPELSDGCTDSPDAGWWGVHRSCCLEHDRAYHAGGSRADRRAADGAFFRCLIEKGMPRPIAWVYFGAVRVGGHPRFRRAGVSWAWGGSRFRYTDPGE